jgi:hypothetical protein
MYLQSIFGADLSNTKRLLVWQFYVVLVMVYSGASSTVGEKDREFEELSAGGVVIARRRGDGGRGSTVGETLM